MPTLTLPQARLAWQHHQQLGAHAAFSDVPGGWSRTLGGASAYLALHARCPDLTRAQVDDALEGDALWVSPGVRGCMWLVSRADLPLAMTVGDAWYRKRNIRDMQKLGVPEAELKRVGEQVLETLGEQRLSPDALRKALPEGSWRSLGDAGKKKGHTTTLPCALRLLEGQGRLRRYQSGGRLDTQRYLWGRAPEGLLDDADALRDPAVQAAELARRFLRWSAPATLQEFVDWSLLGKRVSKAAMAAVGAVAVTVESMGECYALPEQLDGLATHQDEGVYLLPALDNVVAHRSPISPLAAPRWHGLELLGMVRGTTPLHKVKWLHNRPIVHRGELVGFWEWDPQERRVVTAGLRALPEGTQSAVDSTRRFIDEQLDGQARLHSQDALAKQLRRVAWIEAFSPAA